MPQQLEYVATLPCGMFALKNRFAVRLSEANCQARDSHSKHLLTNVHPMVLTVSFFHWREDIYSGHTKNTHRITDCRPYAPTATKKKDVATNACAHDQRSATDGVSRRVTSAWHYTSLILIDQGVKASELY